VKAVNQPLKSILKSLQTAHVDIVSGTNDGESRIHVELEVFEVVT